MKNKFKVGDKVIIKKSGTVYHCFPKQTIGVIMRVESGLTYVVRQTIKKQPQPLTQLIMQKDLKKA